MDITWYGHSCFRIAERGQSSIVTDPFGEELGLPVPKLKADVVTISHNSVGHSAVDTVKGAAHVLNGAGEYEIGGTFITGISLHNLGDPIRPNIAYLFEFGNNLSVLHLGDLAHVPNQSTIQSLGEVSVLLVPVGGGNGMKANMAAEVISLIEPIYIVPMHYALPDLRVELDDVEKFLKAMGVTRVQEEDTLRVTSGSLPEQPQVVILNPQARNTSA